MNFFLRLPQRLTTSFVECVWTVGLRFWTSGFQPGAPISLSYLYYTIKMLKVMLKIKCTTLNGHNFTFMYLYYTYLQTKFAILTLK